MTILKRRHLKNETFPQYKRVKMKILFVNGSPNKSGNTVKLAQILLEGKDFKTINLTDYKIYDYGQTFAGDQFDEVIAAINEADTVVMGSPMYWHNICGLMRNLLDRCYGYLEQGAFSGKNLYFIIQGASPENRQLEACEFTMSRFARMYGFTYKGMATNTREAKSLGLE